MMYVYYAKFQQLCINVNKMFIQINEKNLISTKTFKFCALLFLKHEKMSRSPNVLPYFQKNIVFINQEILITQQKISFTFNDQYERARRNLIFFSTTLKFSCVKLKAKFSLFFSLDTYSLNFLHLGILLQRLDVYLQTTRRNL